MGRLVQTFLNLLLARGASLKFLRYEVSFHESLERENDGNEAGFDVQHVAM